MDRSGRIRYIAIMGGPDKSKESRAARLAEALRENLRRRKNQARARRQAAAPAEGAEPGGGRPEHNGTGGGTKRGSRAAERD
jgi:hypothetical protein